MKRIGLIGGMSWESTATYYRLLNEAVRAARSPLASADVLLHSLDFSAVVALQKAGAGIWRPKCWPTARAVWSARVRIASSSAPTQCISSRPRCRPPFPFR